MHPALFIYFFSPVRRASFTFISPLDKLKSKFGSTRDRQKCSFVFQIQPVREAILGVEKIRNLRRISNSSRDRETRRRKTKKRKQTPKKKKKPRTRSDKI